jgi:hypothetical protein
LRQNGKTAPQAVKEKLGEIRSGFIGSPVEEMCFGPRVFLRVVGKNNRVYSGEWWFDADVFTNLGNAFSRIYFSASDKKEAIRNLLRELLAVSKEWNSIEEVWALEIPPGQAVKAFKAIGSPQKLFNNMPLSATGNRMLVGRAYQYFLPVKNPFWIQKHAQLFV